MFESFNVKGMQQFNGNMVANNIIGLITQLSKYKAELEGKLYHGIGQFVKSTGVSVECGQHHTPVLNDRYFTCKACKAYQNRDTLSTISVAKTGETDLIAAGIVAREPYSSAVTSY